MTKYEELLIEADQNNLVTKEKPLIANDGRIKGNRIAIRRGMTESQKTCILAEELGHHYTAVGDITNQSIVENRKQEMRGRAIAYNRLIGLSGIVDSYKHHCMNPSEIADHLDVTEEFLNEAIAFYHSKYGRYTQIDNYVIFFDPAVAVLELI